MKINTLFSIASLISLHLSAQKMGIGIIIPKNNFLLMKASCSIRALQLTFLATSISGNCAW